MYLLDTNVVSELRKPKPHGAVLEWFESIADDDIFLSAITIGELQAGIELTRRQNPTKAQEIEAWLDEVADSFQILPMDARAFREWAKLMDGRSNHLMEDAMIAATARVHRLTVVTRNARDFESFGVPLINPFASKR
jgi:toxin FitB